MSTTLEMIVVSGNMEVTYFRTSDHPAIYEAMRKLPVHATPQIIERRNAVIKSSEYAMDAVTAGDIVTYCADALTTCGSTGDHAALAFLKVLPASMKIILVWF